MTVDDCYQLGYVIKPHGIRGEVQIFLDVDDPKEYETLESVFALQGQNLVPFFIESIAVRGDKAIVAFEEVETIDAAKVMKGQSLYLPLSELPDLPNQGYYYHELVGLELIDANSGPVGKIEQVMDAGSQMLIQVTHASGKEILVPLIDELIEGINREGGSLSMRVPEGLLDVYLKEE